MDCWRYIIEDIWRYIIEDSWRYIIVVIWRYIIGDSWRYIIEDSWHYIIVGIFINFSFIIFQLSNVSFLWPDIFTFIGSFIYYVRNILRNNNISYPLIRTRKCVRNASFSENFASVLNWWPLYRFSIQIPNELLN